MKKTAKNLVNLHFFSKIIVTYRRFDGFILGIANKTQREYTMTMKFKTFALILALFGFSTSLFAQPAAYSFSSFGGGLPASAKKLSSSETATSQRIIVDDDDEDDYYNDDNDYDYDYSDEPTVKRGRSAGLIATYVVVGIVVVAGIAFGTYYLASESGKCCETTTESVIQGCGEGCGEACGEAIGQSCAESSSTTCESSSSSTECSSTIAGLFAGNGLTLLPIYVP